ncbi:MAG TPA: ribbon-helix-helix protein, CopG family, partial [Ktedonobacteraceae bacterium]
MPQKRTNFYLPEFQLKKLHERSEQENLPVAELIRRAIDAYLAWGDPTYRPTPPHPQTRNAHSS